MSSSAQIFLINCELNCGKHVENSHGRGSLLLVPLIEYLAKHSGFRLAIECSYMGSEVAPLKLLNHKHSWRPVQTHKSCYKNVIIPSDSGAEPLPAASAVTTYTPSNRSANSKFAQSLQSGV